MKWRPTNITPPSPRHTLSLSLPCPLSVSAEPFALLSDFLFQIQFLTLFLFISCLAISPCSLYISFFQRGLGFAGGLTAHRASCECSGVWFTIMFYIATSPSFAFLSTAGKVCLLFVPCWLQQRNYQGNKYQARNGNGPGFKAAFGSLLFFVSENHSFGYLAADAVRCSLAVTR